MSQLDAVSVRLLTGHGLFSADRVDPGTKLLLENLPEGTPTSVLDLGCGYGALGLPIAKTFPDAYVELVDRDLIATAYAEHNAQTMSLHNVHVVPSLGYARVQKPAYDWILCNVPARIGDAAIANFIADGISRLTEHGELRIVVIHDLERAVNQGAKACGVAFTACIKGARHRVYAFRKAPVTHIVEDEIYLRDEVIVAEESWHRSTDASETPDHLHDGLPLLADCLPKQVAGQHVLVVRGGFGLAATILATRGATVTASDRDLLALDFTAKNASKQGVSVILHESAFTFETLPADARFDLIVFEPYEPMGTLALRMEMTMAKKFLKPRGAVLFVGRKKVFERACEELPDAPRAFASRGVYEVRRGSL